MKETNSRKWLLFEYNDWIQPNEWVIIQGTRKLTYITDNTEKFDDQSNICDYFSKVLKISEKDQLCNWTGHYLPRTINVTACDSMEKSLIILHANYYKKVL